MERFGYTSLKKLYKEDAELLKLLEIESYGHKRDEQEKFEALEAEMEHQRNS